MEDDSAKPAFHHKGKKTVYPAWAPIVVALVVVAIGGFMVGMQYQKGHQATATASTAGGGSQFGNGAGGFSRQGMRGGFGQVTAASDSSITVTEMRGNASKTYSITSSTKITKDGAAASASDIATGDRVVVQVNSTNSTQAASIAINPTFNGGPGGTGQAPTTSQTN